MQRSVDSLRIRQARAAQVLAQLGELSSARQALEGFCTVPGNLATLRALSNTNRRPPWARDLLPQSVLEHQATATPSVSCAMSDVPRKVLQHLRPVLEKQSDSELLCNLGQELAEASAPASMVDVSR